MSEVLFAGVPVTDFERACDWYARVFGRPPDVPVHATEAMWRLTEGGWLYVVADTERAGGCLVSIAVGDLDATVAGLRRRHLTPGDAEAVGDAGRKVTVTDPDGNSLSFLEVAASG